MNPKGNQFWTSFEDEEREERIQRASEYREQEQASRFGPPEERQRKNREHVRSLVTQFTEPVVREILRTLCDSEHTASHVFAGIIRRRDPEHGSLDEIIRLHDLAGPRIKIEQPAGPDGWFNVEVSGGWGDAGECWNGVLWKDANGYHVQPTSYCKI